MYGFEHNEIDPYNAVPIRTLKVLLRTNLPLLYPTLQSRIEQAFAIELSRTDVVNGMIEVYIVSAKVAKPEISRLE